MIVFLWAAWILYVTAFVVNHLRVRIERRGKRPEKRLARARLSDLGAVTQFTGLGIAISVRRGWDEPDWLALAGLILAYAGVSLTWWALFHLGRQWRATAVVTDDHDLIVEGPYRTVRHPVYTGLFLMLTGTIFLATDWTAALIAVALMFIGTELRIAAEERLLVNRFPDSYETYRRRTAAWLPPFR